MTALSLARREVTCDCNAASPKGAFSWWASWKGLAISCEPRLALQSQVASESTINYDAVH